MTRVTWRGVTVDARTAAMLAELAAITGDAYVQPTQGSYSTGVQASAGTHAGCGAVDLAAARLTQQQRQRVVAKARQVGFAAWLRTPAQSDWPWHIHAVAVQPGGVRDRGCLSTGAHSQVMDYAAGRNGLASRAPDDGPRQWVGQTWEQYQQTTDWVAMASEAEVRRAVAHAIDEKLPDIARAVNRVLGDFDAAGKPLVNKDNPKLGAWYLRKLRDISLKVLGEVRQ